MNNSTTVNAWLDNRVTALTGKSTAELREIGEMRILSDLDEGDYAVHLDHGIGIFRGIQRVKAMGNERDYIKLEYAGQWRCF